MKLFLLLILICNSSQVFAEVSRSPAIVEEKCELNIETVKTKDGSERIFTGITNHRVPVSADTSISVHENADKEIKNYFERNRVNFSEKCIKYFKKSGLKDLEFTCDAPEIVSMKFLQEDGRKELHKELEDKSLKINIINVEIKYKQIGKKLEEKSVEAVQKEQCARVKECIKYATQNQIPALEKLSAVACKAELSPVSTASAPTIAKEPQYDDGRRVPKMTTDKNDQQKKVIIENNSKVK